MKFLNNSKLAKSLPVVIFGLGILTSVLTNKNNALEREALKRELKEELKNELSSSKE